MGDGVRVNLLDFQLVLTLQNGYAGRVPKRYRLIFVTSLVYMHLQTVKRHQNKFAASKFSVVDIGARSLISIF